MPWNAAIANLRSDDKDLQNQAFQYLLANTNEPVDWAYEIWGPIVETLTDQDNRRRAIAAQVLSNLAKSDPENRMRAVL